VGREQVTAIGRVAPDAAWIGFARTDGGFRLVFGEPDGRLRFTEAPANRLDLLLVALAYFSESAGDPPADLEATQADLAELVGWLAGTESDRRVRHTLIDAIDAIDDGLAAEAVAGALAQAVVEMGGGQAERLDPADLLMKRYESLCD
jgi:hypothetical protein